MYRFNHDPLGAVKDSEHHGFAGAVPESAHRFASRFHQRGVVDAAVSERQELSAQPVAVGLLPDDIAEFRQCHQQPVEAGGRQSQRCHFRHRQAPGATRQQFQNPQSALQGRNQIRGDCMILF